MFAHARQGLNHQARGVWRWARSFVLAGIASLAVLASSAALAKTSVNSVVLTSTTSSATFGVPPTFTILVTAASGATRPTGTVNVTDGLVSGGIACTIVLGNGPTSNVGAGVCIPAASYPVGTRNLIAVYNGDTNYNAEISNDLAMTVVPSFTLTANASAGGTVNPGLRTLVRQGSTVTFDFTPNTGFRLQTVTGVVAGCTVVSAPLAGGVVRYTLSQVNANCSLSGVFSNLYNVTFAADVGGMVSPAGLQRIAFGATPTITVTPNAGFRLVNVTGCGVVFIGGAAITTPTTWTTAAVSSDCTVTAFFTALPTFTVIAAAGAGGSISPSSVAVGQGLTTTFNVTPASGFQIASVTGCGGTRSGSTYTTGPITAACAVTATFSVSATPPAVTTTRMIEFIFPALDYYFLTSRANEIALLDALPAFARTGQSFNVYINRVVGTQPITRFYFNKVALKGARDGHFYTLVDSEISLLLGLNPGNIAAPKLPVSEGVDSFAFPPAVEGIGGTCPSGLIPVFRVFRGNVRFPDDPNHRFTTSTAIYNEFVAKGWDGEGVKLCVPG